MQVDMHEFTRLVRSLLAEAQGEVVAVIEQVGAMPGQGVTSMFTFGRAVGRVEGVLVALGVSIDFTRPQVWKKHFKLSKDKENARALAQRFYPKASLARKKDAGVAEALLIARHYYEARKP